MTESERGEKRERDTRETALNCLILNENESSFLYLSLFSICPFFFQNSSSLSLLAFNSPSVHCSMVGAVNNTVPFAPRLYSRVPIIRPHPLLSLSLSLSLSLHYVCVIATEAVQLFIAELMTTVSKY